MRDRRHPHLMTYPRLSSPAIRLFELFWRPLFSIAAISASLWCYRANAPHD